MLAHSYNEKLDQTGKLASEKLDGVRAIFWNGVFYSRNNNKFNAPAWFIKSMPKVNVPLDGELYTKRGDFHNIMSIVSKNKPVDSEWKKIKYMVFDIIDTGSFTERFNKLKNIVKKAKYIYVVPHIKVKSKTHLKQIQKTVLERGGEGLMLRDPDGVYVNSRSNGLLKVKTFRDAEAVVVKPHLGSGKYNNVMGKLEVHWFKKSKSNTFFVGSGFTDTQRKAYKTLFKPGTIIKVKFFELNESGKPRFPTFIGVRSKKDL
jgi:DNA ligase-1